MKTWPKIRPSRAPEHGRGRNARGLVGKSVHWRLPTTRTAAARLPIKSGVLCSGCLDLYSRSGHLAVLPILVARRKVAQ